MCACIRNENTQRVRCIRRCVNNDTRHRWGIIRRGESVENIRAMSIHICIITFLLPSTQHSLRNIFNHFIYRGIWSGTAVCKLYKYCVVGESCVFRKWRVRLCVSKSNIHFHFPFASLLRKRMQLSKNYHCCNAAFVHESTFQYVRSFLPVHPWYSLDNRTKQLRMHRVNELWHDHTDGILISLVAQSFLFSRSFDFYTPRFPTKSS